MAASSRTAAAGMIIGIDLGTTHSLVARWTERGSELIANSLGEVLTPSVVAVDAAGRVLVGAAARERLLTDPASASAAFKRLMGSEGDIRLGSRSFRPEQLSALVLRSLIADVEATTGESVVEAVISVPAYFGDAQRHATRLAGELAGIKVERLINEPTAAALAYGLQQGADGSRFLVFDLGGGTFDVSILELYDGVMEVHASAGDNYLGGEDFLDLLEVACIQDLSLDAPGPGDRAQLRARLERAKHKLTVEEQVQVELPLSSGVRQWSISEARFASLAQGLLGRLRIPVERALRDARLSAADLDEIVLVGGATRTPMVARLVARLFGRLPLRHVHPDQAIAMGAAVMAGMKARDVAFDEIVVTDVCPYTLGVEVCEETSAGRLVDGLYSPIIERNCVVPVSRVQRYFPIQNGQRLMRLGVYQGESPSVLNNVYLGVLEVPLSPRPRAENPVDVRFTYDVNGLLEVDATVLADKRHVRLLIERNSSLLSPEMVAARLEELRHLKVHPREDQANLALLGRAERLYAEALGELRAAVQAAMVAFRAVLDGQDPRLIAQARTEFAEELEALEMRLG